MKIEDILIAGKILGSGGSGGGGGDMDETLLWTNSNPTASITTQNINLSEPPINFRALKFVVNSNASASAKVFTTTILLNYTEGTIARFGIGGDSGYPYYRDVNVLGDISGTPSVRITLGQCYSLGNATAQNTRTIPYQIYGVGRLSASEIQAVKAYIQAAQLANDSIDVEPVAYTYEETEDHIEETVAEEIDT